jgi:regulator of protease activity HflC (stomatin/prohibitin superfamily)
MPSRTEVSHEAPAAPDGPLFQSVSIAFWVLRAFVIVLFAAWITAGVRPIPPGTQAVVQRFGRIVQVQQSGLLWALPRPLETVIQLPGPDRQLALKIAARTAFVPGIADDMRPGDVPADAGLYLTGDGAVVLLDASINFRISDAAAYTLAIDHVPAALRRLFIDAAVQVAAARQLDDFLAARPERAADPAAQAARNAVRGDLLLAMNRSLYDLAASGAPLGVEITRVDLTALLPPSAKSSFDAVLTATQRAEQGVATARTDATRIRQQAQRDRDGALTAAHAQSEERVAVARSTTASISALEANIDPLARPALMQQLYRDRIAPILAQAASTNAVDPKSVSRVILPGAQ